MSEYPFTLIMIGEVEGRKIFIRHVQISRYVNERRVAINERPGSIDYADFKWKDIPTRNLVGGDHAECFIDEWRSIDNLKLFDKSQEIYAALCEIAAKMFDVTSSC